MASFVFRSRCERANRRHPLPSHDSTIATATELQRARNLGLDCVKFFPAGLAGGTKMLGAFGAVFRDMRFMPTGGVPPANLADYLALPQVVACGGSWLTPAAAIADGDYGAITRLAEEALRIAATARP